MEVAATPRGRELILANLEVVLSFVIMVSKEGELLVKILMFLSILGSTQGRRDAIKGQPKLLEGGWLGRGAEDRLRHQRAEAQGSGRPI
ncbi:hypothetical protein OPV22_014152 [Ensete ventricosum]|uniref:Uncharacterized protein n=1 Tax=Ensete ventricosum TaxID=4639 RepID=A0AAV8R6H7_ENSVE|nr:hypothetical protein OPV22_014152 [Ensete ventricosum]